MSWYLLRLFVGLVSGVRGGHLAREPGLWIGFGETIDCLSAALAYHVLRFAVTSEIPHIAIID